jgi:hypothetical protein
VVQPSCLVVAPGGAQLIQTWRLTISIPAALRPSAPRPILGEVWIGKLRTLDRSPQLQGLGVKESDPDQVRVETSRKRIEILSSRDRAPAELELSFRVPVADYVRVRDEIQRLTAFGTDPILLIPSAAFEGGRFYHGRVGEEIFYARITPAEHAEEWREFGLAFTESPFPPR